MSHKTYVTFGQDHAHAVNGQTLDKDCVAVIHSSGPEEGSELAFEYFGKQFCLEYPEAYFDHAIMEYFPRGLIEVNGP